MIVAKEKIGAKQVELARDWKTVTRYAVPAAGRLPKLSAYLDGLGTGDELAPLTVSGNELTDITRKAAFTLGTGSSGQMIDGRLNDSSFGIRRAATNLFRQGQCGATTDWLGATATPPTISIDATTRPPFSTQSIKGVCSGAAASQGFIPSSATGQAAVATTPGVGSIYAKLVNGASYVCRMEWVNTDATVTQGTDTGLTGTGAFQLIIPTSVLVAAGKTGDQLRIRLFINGTRAETIWVAHVMLEKGVAVVASYVPTTGGSTATHSGGRVRAPASLLNTTQGWMATRVRMGWSSSNPPDTFPNFFDLRDDATHRLILFWFSGGFSVGRDAGSVGSNASSALSFSAGDFVTIVAAWTATTIKVSVNGSAFVSIANTTIPTIAASQFDLGNVTGNSHYADSDVLWFACGLGPLTDPDAAALAALTKPANLAALPSTSLPTMLWKANTTNYRIPGVTGPGTLIPVIYDAAGNLVGTGDPITIQAGSVPAWYDFTFSKVPGGVPLLAASYDIGFEVGGVASHVVRLYSDGAGVGQMLGDTFSDGPAATFGTGWPTLEDITVYGDVFQPWTAPTNLDEFTYARLPMAEAQKVFKTTPPVFGSGIVSQACFHGTGLDPERGSFAVVQAGGILDALVGERVKITRTSFGVKRSVLAYVHNSLLIDDVGGVTPDLSLPRRVWAQLALLGDDMVEVIVERLA